MEPSDKPVVDQSEDCEEKPAKKIKLADGKEENEAAAAPAVVVDTEEDAAVEAGAKPDEPHCLVCMEPDNPDSPLQKHHCPQCVENAWLICVCCNEALLSRTCPVCRGNYAPIVMHPMPGLPLKKLADPTLTAEERATLLYKFGVVRQLITKSNVAVWTSSDQSMHFSLPQKMTETSEDVSVVIVSIPFDLSRLQGGKFLFNNDVWDEIENTIEHGAVHAGEMVDLSKATQWLLSFTKEDGHSLFTMMAPDDWTFMLDPGESPDINDALKAIRECIVQNIRLPTQGPSEVPAGDSNSTA